jgi:NADH:ubiquinone oxidoreductase subunit E
MPRQTEPRNLERDRIRRAILRFAPGSEARILARAIQDALDYLPDAAIGAIATHSGASDDEVRRDLESDVELRRVPYARHRVAICTGRTCARRGGARLLRVARLTLGIEPFRTTPDAAIRIEPFRCFGECAMAPNVRIDGATRGAMTESRFRLLLGVLGRTPS